MFSSPSLFVPLSPTLLPALLDIMLVSLTSGNLSIPFAYFLLLLLDGGSSSWCFLWIFVTCLVSCTSSLCASPNWLWAFNNESRSIRIEMGAGNSKSVKCLYVPVRSCIFLPLLRDWSSGLMWWLHICPGTWTSPVMSGFRAQVNLTSNMAANSISSTFWSTGGRVSSGRKVQEDIIDDVSFYLTGHNLIAWLCLVSREAGRCSLFCIWACSWPNFPWLEKRKMEWRQLAVSATGLWPPVSCAVPTVTPILLLDAFQVLSIVETQTRMMVLGCVWVSDFPQQRGMYWFWEDLSSRSPCMHSLKLVCGCL